MEQWKGIPGTKYSVSSEGRVASRNLKWGGWRVMNPSTTGKYLHICMWINGSKKSASVHRLVAEAFLGPPPTLGHEVNHKDGIRHNNRTENLEWVSQSENVQHSYSVLGHKAARGEAAGPSRITEVQAREVWIRRAAGESLGAISADYGITKATVCDIYAGRSWAWISKVTP